MILSINKYEWKRVKINNVQHVLPDETTYWFETGIRRSIKMIPIWTTWQKEQDNKPEEIWKYVFILVYLNFECSVEKITVQVSDIERREEIEQFKDKKLIATFASLNEASRQTNISLSNICLAANGKRKTAGGFIWKKK